MDVMKANIDGRIEKPRSGRGLEFVIDVSLLHDAVSGMTRLDLCIHRKRSSSAWIAPDVVVPFPMTFESATIFFEDVLHFWSEV